MQDFEAVKSIAENLPLATEHLDCVLTFNAIHHIQALGFLSEASRVLKRNGYLFIYTRLRSQNRRNIWGRHFPLFSEKETRLYESRDLEQMVEATAKLRIEDVRFFRYERASTLNRLLELVSHRHYSTFSQYTDSELRACVVQFEKNVRRTFDNPDNVRWTDENAMLTIRKD